MKRLVETERWRDSFFVELHPNAKLLLSYIYDTCNDAGFIDLNWAIWESQLNMPKDFIKTSLNALQKLLLSDKKKKLFIKDFLKHQRKLPLIKGNEESDLIIEKLESNLKKFNDAPEILEILNSVRLPEKEEEKESTRSPRKKFSAPKYEVFEEYYLSEKPETDIENIKDLYDHYVKVGWKTTSGTKISDYEAAIRNAIRRDEKKSNTYQGQRQYKNDKPSRTEVTLNVVDTLKKQNAAKHGN